MKKKLFKSLIITAFLSLGLIFLINKTDAKTYVSLPENRTQGNEGFQMLPDVIYLGQESVTDNVYATKADLRLSVANEDQTRNDDLRIMLSEHTAFQLVSTEPVALFDGYNYYEVKTRAMGADFTEKYNPNNQKIYISERNLKQNTTYVATQLDSSALTPAEIAAVNKRAFDSYKNTSLDPNTVQTLWSYGFGSGIYTGTMRAGLYGKAPTDYADFIYTTDENGNVKSRYSMNRTMPGSLYNFFRSDYSIRYGQKKLSINENNINDQNVRLNEFTQTYPVTWNFGRTVALYRGTGGTDVRVFSNPDDTLDNYNETPDDELTQTLNKQYKPGDKIYDLSISSFSMNPNIATSFIEQRAGQSQTEAGKNEKTLFILELREGTQIGSSIDSFARYGIGFDVSGKEANGGNNAIANFLNGGSEGEDPNSEAAQSVGEEFVRTVVNNLPTNGDEGPKTQAEIIMPMSYDFIVTKLETDNPNYPGMKVVYLEPVGIK